MHLHELVNIDAAASSALDLLVINGLVSPGLQFLGPDAVRPVRNFKSKRGA
jgi:hypothetical protein